MATQTKSAKKNKDQRPDDGQGSKGNFGSDGDWGKPVKKADKEKVTSPVPPKKQKASFNFLTRSYCEV